MEADYNNPYKALSSVPGASKHGIDAGTIIVVISPEAASSPY